MSHTTSTAEPGYDSFFEPGNRVTVAYNDGWRMRYWHGTYTDGPDGDALIMAFPGFTFDFQDLPDSGDGYRLHADGLLVTPRTPGWTISPLDEYGQRLFDGQTEANIERARMLRGLVTKDRTVEQFVNRLNKVIDTLIAEAYERGKTGQPMPTPHGPIRPSDT